MFTAKALRTMVLVGRCRATPGHHSPSRPATFFLLVSIFCVLPAAAQRGGLPAPGSLEDNLRQYIETPSVSGYEAELAEKIRAKIAAFHPATDNLGDVIVTIGSGAPHRLIVTPIDEPGFVVSGIASDGYLRLQRLPQSGLPPIFNELYSAQPVQVGTTSGKWINGVVAGPSIHLQSGSASLGKLGDIENMYVDIGATSAAEVRAAGVDLLSPVVIDRHIVALGTTGFIGGRKESSSRRNLLAGESIGDKFGAAALVDLLQQIDPAKVKGTLTVAFVVQQRTGARGLQRVLSTTQADEMIYVGRLLPGGAIPGVQGMRRAPRRELGSGVLLGLGETNGTLSGFAADLEQLADANKIPLATDYSAGLVPPSYLPTPSFPAKWVHLGIATAWPDTPAETIDLQDLNNLVRLLDLSLEGPRSIVSKPEERWMSASDYFSGGGASITYTLQRLVELYGASNHEEYVRYIITDLLPQWAKPETDGAGNLILHIGTAPAGSKTPGILVIAHMDEIGFEVKSISKDGRLEVETLGGMNLSYYEGHPVLVHTKDGSRDGIIELPNGWDEANFQWPGESEKSIRVDVGARNADDVAELDIKVGESVTIPKEYRPLLGTRASARSFDDRVGCAALVSAVWALGGPMKDRDVTFVWSTGEELGLEGAAALAKRLAADGREPDYVFAVDTFVSSDSPIESKRFADAELGKGFVIRAVDTSNIIPRDLVERLARLARINHIPVQYGVTGGGNDGSAFVRYGAVDVALGWPLRYSHSPAEVIDTRDVDALARIVAVVAKSW